MPSGPTAPPVRLDTRTFKVEELVQMVLDGRIRIPTFQRGIKWGVAEAFALLDSIDRGYPIGTLLLWPRPAKRERLEHGTAVVDAPERDDALWVVDGQQRLLALTRLFAGAGAPTEPFAASYDLHDGRLKHRSRDISSAAHDLPLTELLDPVRTVDWFHAHPELKFDRHGAIQQGKRLREYMVPAYVVITDDQDTVREIFSRLNNHARHMSSAEVFDALSGADGSSPTSLADVAASLATLNFGPLDEPTLSRMQQSLPADDDDSELSHERVMTALQRAAHRAVRFLRDDAAIPHISLLPYREALFALARFFHFSPEPHPRTRELLVRWLWRAFAVALRRGDLFSSELTLAAIDPDEYGTVQRLLRDLHGRKPLSRFTDHLDWSDPHFKMQIAALLSLGPRHLNSGDRVAAKPADMQTTTPYQSLLRPIFPATKYPDLSNHVLHPPAFIPLREALVHSSESTLATHAISPHAREELERKQAMDFNLARRGALVQLVDDFVARHAQWDEPDTPPVEALHIGSD